MSLRITDPSAPIPLEYLPTACERCPFVVEHTAGANCGHPDGANHPVILVTSPLDCPIKVIPSFSPSELVARLQRWWSRFK